MSLQPEVQKRVEQWLKPPFDDETRRQVQNLLDHDPKALVDLFYTTISFGTGGMRGVMGIGTNRMNPYTIRSATQGLANYILKHAEQETKRVFIGYDCRKNSRKFAEETARVLAANGIEAHVTKELRPTPYVSFGCRHLNCTAAVMITASHNPPEYNGYKVYWSDGAQVVPPHDTGIIEEVKKVDTQEAVKIVPFDHSLIHEVGKDVDEAYYEALAHLQNFPKDNKQSGSKLKLLYSSLHGTGITLMPEALKRWGFTDVSFVEKQIIPDGSFPTAHSPNPEQAEALHLGVEQLLREQRDLFIATDPDADRMGVVVNHHGEAVILNGNQVAALCLFYLCTTKSKLGTLPENSAAVTTIVTTDLFPLIATAFNLTCFQVLTGFKYIGEKIHQWENGPFTFLFGAEESLGYLYGTHSRDKDAMIAGCLLSEIALQEKLRNKTLVDFLHDIYRQFGLFRQKQLSVSFGSGQEGAEKMQQLMTALRSAPPKEICGQQIVTYEDYQTGVKTHAHSGKKEKLILPKSNVLVFILEDESKFIIRPSGTEPKIKIYGMVRQKLKGDIEEGLQTCDRRLDKILKTLKENHLS